MKKVFSKKYAININSLIDKQCANRLESRSGYLLNRRGTKMVTYANDLIGLAVDCMGFYEFDDLVLLFDFLKPLENDFKHGTVLDIGANIGNHSLFFSRFFNSVHAYEPHPLTVRLLMINASQSNNITVHPYGLGNEHARVSMTEDPVNLGGSQITEHGVNTIEIEIKRLDDEAIDYQNVKLVKIDVEGYEINVLRGGLEFFEKNQPLILFELHENDFSQGTPEVIKVLQNLDYKLCWINPRPKNIFSRLMKIVSELIFGRITDICTGNEIPASFHSMVIAVPKKWSSQLGVV